VYDYGDGKQNWLAAGLPTEGKFAGVPRAGTLARLDAPTCRLDDRLGEVAERVRAQGWDVCVVVNEHRIVLGILRSEHLKEDPGRRVEEVMQPGPSTFRPHVFITEMAEFMLNHDMASVPITTGEGELVGVLRQEDAVEAAGQMHAGHEHEGDDDG
jgi:Mg/Co/Ni transporter MgtE